MPGDLGQALQWALDHVGGLWWAFGLLIAMIAWTFQRLREFGRADAPPAAPNSPAAKAQAAAPYAAAPAYAAPGYAAQPAYTAPVAAAAAQAPSSGRTLHRETAPAQRAVTPAAGATNVPAAPPVGGRRLLDGMFGDPAHARNAIIVAEIVGPPVALR